MRQTETIRLAGDLQAVRLQNCLAGCLSFDYDFFFESEKFKFTNPVFDKSNGFFVFSFLSKSLNSTVCLVDF